MYRKIMTPVDLAHVDQLQKAIHTSADLARQYRIPIVFVGVTSTAPSAVAHTPQEFDQKLAAFSRDKASALGVTIESKACVSHDPSIDLDGMLIDAVKETGADLVVMASHVPNVTDYLWPSHGGRLATHSDASVFIVR